MVGWSFLSHSFDHLIESWKSSSSVPTIQCYRYQVRDHEPPSRLLEHHVYCQNVIMPSVSPQFMPMESTTRSKRYAFVGENSIHCGTYKDTI